MVTNANMVAGDVCVTSIYVIPILSGVRPIIIVLRIRMFDGTFYVT